MATKKNKPTDETLAEDVMGTAPTATAEAPVAEEKSPEELALDKEIADLKAKLKELTAQKKGTEPREPREVKGVWCAFKNKKGDKIVGKGVEYMVARMDGKLHYKEKSQVIFLPENYKEGDPIDWSLIPEKEVKTEEEAVPAEA
jgi:hypothetical protein